MHCKFGAYLKSGQYLIMGILFMLLSFAFLRMLLHRFAACLCFWGSLQR